MRVRVLLSIAMLSLSILLAGCSSDEDPEPSDILVGETSAPPTGSTSAAPTSGAPTSGPAPTSSAPTGDNAAPTLTLTVDVAEGEAPLAVVFTLAGEDADGDDLQWALDADGDGEADAEGDALPATVEFTYEEAGDYTAVAIVSDGVDEASAEAAVSVLDGAGDDSEPVQVHEGGYAAGAGAGCSPVGGYLNALNGVFDHFQFAPDPASAGLPFTAEYAFQGAAVELVVQFWAGGSSVVGDFRAAGDAGTVVGTVPEGADTVIVSSCGGAEVSVLYVAG